LIIHGTEDVAFPPAHARALADEIPGARLIMIERLGHVTAPASFPTIVPASCHTSGRRPARVLRGRGSVGHACSIAHRISRHRRRGRRLRRTRGPAPDIDQERRRQTIGVWTGEPTTTLGIRCRLGIGSLWFLSLAPVIATIRTETTSQQLCRTYGHRESGVSADDLTTVLKLHLGSVSFVPWLGPRSRKPLTTYRRG
jgi:hypothetical protein